MIETSCSSKFNIDTSKDFNFFSFSNNKISLSDAPILQPIKIEIAIKAIFKNKFAKTLKLLFLYFLCVSYFSVYLSLVSCFLFIDIDGERNE